MLGRHIHDFPIAEFATPTKRHRTGAYTAQWQGYLTEMVLIVRS